MSRRLPRLLSIVAALVLLAAACGDSGSNAETNAAPAAGASDGSSDSDAASGDTSGEDPTDDAVTVDAGSTDAERASWPHTFVADQVGGGQLDANDLAGQDVILWFWAPW